MEATLKKETGEKETNNMNIKFILSRLSACAIAVALSTNTANAKVTGKKVLVVTSIPEKIEVKKFTEDDIVEPAQEEKAKPAFEEIVKAAGNGKADMQLELGWRYFNGTDTETNFVKAAECFHKAAEQGNREAQFNIGAMYAEGIGVEKNWAEAAAWFTKAAAQGHAKAKANLCVMYAEGIGVEKNPAEAEKYLNDAVVTFEDFDPDDIDPDDIDDMGRRAAYVWRMVVREMYPLSGILRWRFHTLCNNVWFEHSISERWIHKLAERGRNDLALYFGDYFYQRDWKEAVKWYRVAAEKMEIRTGRDMEKYVQLLSRIGFIYDKGGYGVDEDNAEAVKWYDKAVGKDKTNASALRLADMYFDGEGVGKDPRMAVNLLYQRMEDSRSKYVDRDVCRRLARCYIDGEGVPENMFMAAIWWLKAERLNWILVFTGLTGIIAIGSIMIVSICFAIICIKKIFS